MSRSTWIAGLVGSLVIVSCGEEVDPAQRATEIISTRTVGLAYLEENRLPEAEVEFRKLIELVPDEHLAYANLGLVYLRMNMYPEAEEQLDEALSLESEDPRVHLLLSELYKATSRTEAGIRILDAGLEQSPGNTKILYGLSQIYGQRGDEDGSLRSEYYLGLLVASDPTNLAARMQLTEALVRNGRADSAVAQFEEIRRQVPELPREGVQFFDGAMEALRDGRIEEALTPTVIAHNFIKVTPLYQQGLVDLQGPGGASVGFPIFTFTQNISGPSLTQEAVLEAIRFTDATAVAGLDAVSASTGTSARQQGDVAVGDFDDDGDQDLFVSYGGAGAPNGVSYLLRNDFGHFSDISSDAGIDPSGPVGRARFADFDNDSILDLFVAGGESNVLYKVNEEGEFRDVTRDAGVGASGRSNSSVFVDIDHDGDLDLYVANTGGNRVYRNNGDGSFTEVAERMGVVGGSADSRDVVFADFDEDGDIDLFVANEDTGNVLYTNLRQGRLGDVTQESGLGTRSGSRAAVAGDYDNDGFMDLFVTGLNGHYQLYRNRGDGTFEADTRSAALTVLENVDGADAVFFDFDNDGYLDLFVVGSSQSDGERGVFLFRNDGAGQFDDRSDLLPNDFLAAQRVEIADYNEDGDIDLFVSDLSGSVRLLRNDGGNANHYLKIQLVGLMAGSGKNNHFGIGAKLEVRAGELYQTKVVTSALNHFGLGHRLKADVVRIVWTNGVPQNQFFPGSDQDLIEEQVLKGSCGFLYTWNGEDYSFTTDMVWRSALGMPQGIMGGRAAYASAHPSREYLRIPGDALKEKDGVYSIQITEELWETLYLDELRLIVVDHPDSVDVYVDEGFEPTSAEIPSLELLQVGDKYRPSSATDDKGRQWRKEISEKDDVYVAGFTPDKYQGVTKLHDLILDLGSDVDAANALLFLNGWIFPTDASINVAMSQTDAIESIAPYLQVRDESGMWQTVIESISFPMGKNKTMVVDLANKFLSDDRSVRIRTNMEIYWDYIFFTNGTTDGSPRLTTLEPISADLHYRGFSRLYRKGGPNGPHWFDYSTVSTEPKWLDMLGYYTRYGDVLSLLEDDDSKYIIMNAGDEITVEFDASVPEDLPAGWRRDFLIYSTGWLKDADINTASGQTVGPLPFHGMSEYPYGVGESYPTDKDHQNYVKTYNTRKVKLKK